MTIRRIVQRLILVGLVSALPAAGYAQEAIVIGTVTDTTGGVLPGVTVVAVHSATGNVFETVTDEAGEYRLPVRVGTYEIRAQLAGFQTLSRSGVELLLSRQVPINFQLAPATIQETVTVTGEAPLVDTTGSTVAANIDPRQMEALPINGRNWMDLSLLAPGARRNEAGGFIQNRQGYSQTNVDGQEVTAQYHSGGDDEQPGYSRDAIAEFEVIANRFDASQGRSSGMVVNAVTKSGTNTLAGMLGGYFRDDSFNAKDFFRNRVLPYQNQQVSGTLGGPIIRDRFHFFGSYEYERQPQTYVYTSPFPFFNIDLKLTNRVHKFLGRGDFQFTPQRRLSVRASRFDNVFWRAGGATDHPSAARHRRFENDQVFGTFTQVIGDRTVNELKGGRLYFDRNEQPIVRWQGGKFPHAPVGLGGSVGVDLPGYSIGGVNTLGVTLPNYQVRNDFITSFTGAGRHDVKLGGEYIRYVTQIRWCLRCDGVLDLRGPGTRVPAALLQELFPVWNDASTWNTEPLTPFTRWVFNSLSPTQSKLGPFRQEHTRHIVAGWVQDDWRVTNSLTLNLGVRYDVDTNSHSEKVKFLPWLPGNLPHDTNDVAPRLGLNYRLDDDTVVRGGYGLFFTFSPNDGVHQTQGYCCVRFEWQIFNDGSRDFARWDGTEQNKGWFHGPTPSYETAIQNACDVNNGAPGCAFRSLVQEINYPGRRTSYSHQASVGIQRQIGTTMSFETNYVYTGGRLEETARQINLTYNPATGANYPFRDISRRPFPTWGAVNFELLEGWSNYHGWDSTFTKRFSDNWQLQATYTLAYFYDASAVPDQWYLGDDGVVARRPIGFPVARDLGGEYGLAGAAGGFAGSGADQRHRATVNGIWNIGYGVQFSGLYFFGSGERRTPTVGRDLREVGSLGEQRLRLDGTILERNSLVGDPLHRVDMRLQKRFALGGRAGIDGIWEVFNLFNHRNYGTYVLNESNANFGQPTFNPNLSYAPRMMQFGLRFAF
jgi:hypothetical protein